jgi:glycine/D-amino acid oxidase-like deaminating enzyme
MTERVAVVGGGAVGLTAAYDMAVAGADVTLFERGTVGDDDTAGSTPRAAGVVYDAFAEDVDAAVADRALERFRAFDGEGGFSFVDCPYVMVAREGDDEAVRAVEAGVEGMTTHGRDVSLVDPDDLGERFPLSTDDVAVAVVAEDGGWTDTAAYARLLAETARDAGVDVREGERVSLSVDPPGVETGGGVEAFDAVAVAAGAWTKRLFAEAGVEIPLKPYRVQALTSGRAYDGPICFDASGGFYFRPHPDGLLAGDGTEPVEVDPDGWEPTADDWFVDDVAAGLRTRADHDPDVERAWAGLCAATPDRDPLLGELEDGVYVAAGWQGHGFMRAPATGEALAEAVLGADPTAGGDDVPSATTAFDPTRFDGDEEFEIVEGMAVEE